MLTLLHRIWCALTPTVPPITAEVGCASAATPKGSRHEEGCLETVGQASRLHFAHGSEVRRKSPFLPLQLLRYFRNLNVSWFLTMSEHNSFSYSKFHDLRYKSGSMSNASWSEGPWHSVGWRPGRVWRQRGWLVSSTTRVPAQHSASFKEPRLCPKNGDKPFISKGFKWVT